MSLLSPVIALSAAFFRLREIEREHTGANGRLGLERGFACLARERLELLERIGLSAFLEKNAPTARRESSR